MNPVRNYIMDLVGKKFKIWLLECHHNDLGYPQKAYFRECFDEDIPLFFRRKRDAEEYLTEYKSFPAYRKVNIVKFEIVFRETKESPCRGPKNA